MRKTGVIVAVAVAIVAGLAFVLVTRGPEEVRLEGACTELPVDGQVRDLLVTDRGIAYVATDKTVALVDLNVTTPRTRAALVVQPQDFRPAGISLFQNRLFVVDRHEDAPSQIVIFEQTPTGAFAPAGKPIRDELFTAPDAVRATGPNQFYVANEAKFFFEDPTVAYYDGTKAEDVTAAAPERNHLVSAKQRSLAGAADGKLMLCQK